ncbi:hypothetical protein BGZ96_008390 [Linnemannia gamsii]|uniref:Heterokaryon incompatibility domain-containing protein n=1 Tax=Linnemannia gamsii TaxID=64522 RepID=A0ABQ7K0G4_9FUNG|nr:hypothetical protein BGZ96_008390 [Linnemannia gamsii]
MPKGPIPKLERPSDVSLSSDVTELLADFGRLETGPKLDQFSMQLTFIDGWNDAKIKSQLDLGSLSDANQIISYFGVFGGTMDYQGVRGYDPERVRQIALLSCRPQERNELPSEIFGTHDMGEYGSGGLPEFLHPWLAETTVNSARVIDAESRQYAHDPEIMASFEYFYLFKQREIFGDLAWCRAARSILVCAEVSGILGGDLSDWLIKVAVHAACTMERVRSRALKASKATIILFQLSRELGYVLGRILFDNPPSKTLAIIISLLIEVGFGFISAGLCEFFTQQQDKGYSRLMFGLSEHCGSMLTTTGRSNPKKLLWKKLTKDCVRLSNFCPSRANTVVELQPSEMFHLIARCEHISTDLKLHETCDDSCSKAQSVENYQRPGHLEEGCKCQETRFEPKETAQLVLFDIKKKKLFEPKFKTPYVAVSQVWFQGIFGQESRTCGTCSLDRLAVVCNRLGVRYVWIDTLCMPTSKKLRNEVVAQLRDIYLKADATLVVDAGLILTTARTVLDLSLAVLMSDWSSRVWTLQEGVLASKLLFCVGDQVLSLPQVYGADLFLDPRRRVPSKLLRAYGMKSRGLGQSLENVIGFAAGRQTSHPCDYLYGLSALLCYPPERQEDLHSVAKEVAGMYSEVDLGILLGPFPRCEIENYRWMPRRAKQMSGGYHTGLSGSITPDGLRCRLTAFIKLTSIVDDDHTRGTSKLEMRMNLEAEISIKNWYKTETQGVFVGTEVEASQLIFCLVGHREDRHSFGFVVSPTDYGNFQYMGCAVATGMVSERPVSILVT